MFTGIRSGVGRLAPDTFSGLAATLTDLEDCPSPLGVTWGRRERGDLSLVEPQLDAVLTGKSPSRFDRGEIMLRLYLLPPQKAVVPQEI